ncbi:DNA-binding protein [Streptomyces sp. NPDC058045]|uniref:DNA-binding protein n=1 Tax=Streptomyces sp. NPDC058045 TaxID=3346311 RepID=UPI0036F16D13
MTKRTVVRHKTLSASEALDLPVMFDVWPTLGAALGIGRTTTFQLAREGALPIPIIRVGRQLRARRSDLLNFLGLQDQGAAKVELAAPAEESDDAPGVEPRALVEQPTKTMH